MIVCSLELLFSSCALAEKRSLHVIALGGFLGGRKPRTLAARPFVKLGANSEKNVSIEFGM